MTLYPTGGATSTTLHSRGSMPPLSDFIAGIDLPQLVEHYAGPGKHSGGSYLFKCPNPDHYDGHPSFSVFTGKGGAWRCHCLSQCGHVGDALDFLAWQLRCDKSDALRTLRTWAGQPTALPYATQAKKVSKQVAQVKTDPGYTEVNDLAAMSDYLTARQWPAEVVEAFGLRIVRLNRASERNTVRVLHPFYEHRAGEWCATSWQARRLDNVTDSLIDWANNEITDGSTLATMAFLFAADGAVMATDRSLHYHGGYGFAEEYDIQMYYRRARGWSLILGDSTSVGLSLADRLFGTVEG